MALTRIDCQIYRNNQSAGESSLYAVLNPTREPGTLVAVGTIAARENLGGQVACKLALEHFVEAVLDAAPDLTRSLSIEESENRSIAVVEEAFRRANSSVYEFGHKLAAGGRMASSLIGFYIRERVVAVGRAGNVSSYLLRGSEVCPFFNDAGGAERHSGFVGENSVVTVELSSIELRAHDIVIAFPTLLSDAQRGTLAQIAFRAQVSSKIDAAELSRAIYGDQKPLPFVLQAQLGPEVIYLNKAMGLGFVGNAAVADSHPAKKVSDLG